MGKVDWTRSQFSQSHFFASRLKSPSVKCMIFCDFLFQVTLRPSLYVAVSSNLIQTNLIQGFKFDNSATFKSNKFVRELNSS